MLKARKTYVVSYYNEQGVFRQEYYQNKRKAQVRANKLGLKRGKASLMHWIDGAEMIRLARKGYFYDSMSGTCKPSARAKDFIAEVDAMDENERRSKFLDYRKFKNIDEVREYHESMKGVLNIVCQ